jgi:hypothetical protein
VDPELRFHQMQTSGNGVSFLQEEAKQKYIALITNLKKKHVEKE